MSYQPPSEPSSPAQPHPNVIATPKPSLPDHVGLANSQGGPDYVDKQENGLAIASLVLGIVGLIFAFVFVGIIFSILAVILGHNSLKQIKQNNDAEGGRGLAIVGSIFGYIVIAFFAAIFGMGIIATIIRAIHA